MALGPRAIHTHKPTIPRYKRKRWRFKEEGYIYMYDIVVIHSIGPMLMSFPLGSAPSRTDCFTTFQPDGSSKVSFHMKYVKHVK